MAIDDRALVENERNVLTSLDHSNIIRVVDVGKFDIITDSSSYQLSYIVEPFISDAKTLRQYVEGLSHYDKEVNESSIDSSLRNLVKALRQWVDALTYVHRKGYVYLDVKPENAIVGRDEHLLLIDFGSVRKVEAKDNSVDVQFTPRYADPRLREKRFRATSPERVRSAVKQRELVPDLDYYALGKSILELLTIISKYHPHDFPARPLFNSLHFLATRLLNGSNESRRLTPSEHDYFNREIFGGLQKSDYSTIKYKNLTDVIRDLDKEYGSWDPENVIPELSSYPKNTLRVVPRIHTVFTPRLRILIEHPLVARLKMVSQLGLITLVYLTADHARYDHILGAYTYTASYIKALFKDTENCIFRNLVDENDIKAALLAPLVHDLGQYPLAHDLAEVSPEIFGHTSISIELLSDQTKDAKGRTLLDIIQDRQYGWGVDAERLKTILGAHSRQPKLTEISVGDFKADMLAALIDGPIDADKADYILRDSSGCRVPYGEQLDIERLLRVLTSVRIPEHLEPGQKHRVTVGVYEKGIASASAFSLARYLLFASIYWHHTSRILKAMLQYATAMILPTEVFYESRAGRDRTKEIHERLLRFVANLVPPFDQAARGLESRLLERTTPIPKQAIFEKQLPDNVLESLHDEEESEEYIKIWYPGVSTTDWLVLDWLKSLSESKEGERGIALINSIQQRELYKRVYTIPRDEESRGLIEILDKLNWPQRIELCESMQKIIETTLIEREPDLETRPLTSMNDVQRICSTNLAILLDIPDPSRMTTGRPLIFVPELERKTYYHASMRPAKANNLTNALDYLAKSISPIRVLCHPDIRQWIGVSIEPPEMATVIEEALREVKK